MKNNTCISFVFIVLAFLSFKGFGQNQEIVADTDTFDYLIGVEYSDVSELDGLVYKTRTGMTKGDIETSSTNFTQGTYQIITSESVRHDATTHKKMYKIQDVIVLNGSYSLCEGCLVTEIKNSTIKSIHSKGKNQKETILLAFERNDLTGIYKQVDPNKYIWNKKADLLQKF